MCYCLPMDEMSGTLTRACEDCGAQSGKPCVSPNGNEYPEKVTHWTRRSGRSRFPSLPTEDREFCAECGEDITGKMGCPISHTDKELASRGRFPSPPAGDRQCPGCEGYSEATNPNGLCDYHNRMAEIYPYVAPEV